VSRTRKISGLVNCDVTLAEQSILNIEFDPDGIEFVCKGTCQFLSRSNLTYPTPPKSEGISTSGSYVHQRLLRRPNFSAGNYEAEANDLGLFVSGQNFWMELRSCLTVLWTHLYPRKTMAKVI
jgi:hypothetical protein